MYSWESMRNHQRVWGLSMQLMLELPGLEQRAVEVMVILWIISKP